MQHALACMQAVQRGGRRWIEVRPEVMAAQHRELQARLKGSAWLKRTHRLRRVSTSPGPRSYSTAAVAQRLGVSVPTVQRWVDAGELKAWKTLGGHRRIDGDSVEQLSLRLQQGAAPDPRPNFRRAAGPLVMVVDDNPNDRDLLSLLVRSALPGARLSVHDNGFDALLAIGAAAPMIVISDLAMPHMDGFEMLRQLALQPLAARLFAVSSLTPAQVAQRGGLPAGVQLVAKPIEPAGLVELLRAAAAYADNNR